jgi:hypothetical protein
MARSRGARPAKSRKLRAAIFVHLLDPPIAGVHTIAEQLGAEIISGRAVVHLDLLAWRIAWSPIAHSAPLLAGLGTLGELPYLRVMNLDLTDAETPALLRLLTETIDGDRFPLSPRIQTLRAIRAKLRPEPPREPLPPPKRYEPPRAVAAKRRRRG